MDNILFRSGNDVDSDNYLIIYLLIIWLIFKVFYTGIFSFINGSGNLYLIFKPIIFYLINYFILVIINRKNDSYYIILSLTISFLLSSKISLFLFVIFCVIGNVICYLFKNKFNSVIIICLLLSLCFDSSYIIDCYSGMFYYGYLFLCIVSLIFLIFNKLFKYHVFIFSFMCIVFINIINGNYFMDISFFFLLFIVSDNRFSPFIKKCQIYSGILFGIFIFVFEYLFSFNCYLFLSIFLYEIFSIGINYLSFKLCDNKIFNYLFIS